MNKKSIKALASTALMALVITTAFSNGLVKAEGGQAKRVGEADRYATAVKVATTNWTTSDNVLLVSGEGYADAVNASVLAKKLNAPILLTTAGELTKDTKDALSTLKAKNIYLVGGKASVSQAVRDTLKSSYNLVEIGGENRYETNAAVAEKLVELGVDPSNVIMVGGEGFSDALSVAPIAAAKEQILLLGINDGKYIKPILDFIDKNKSKVTIVGSENVINDETLNFVGGTRIDGGKDRWETNLKVLDAFKDSFKKDKLYIASASCNTKDDGYADSLVASTLAGKTSSPLVLVDKEKTDGTTNAISYIKDNASKTTELNVVGGTGVILQSTVDDILKEMNEKKEDIGETTVQSIEAVSINEFKVKFNTAINSDSAKNVTNYKVDGVQLTSASKGKAVDENGAVGKTIDSKTVLITLAKPRKQYDNVKVSVKEGILASDKKRDIASFEKSITFSDTTHPTLKSVTPKGNNTITVEFSEAVNVKDINTLKNKIKIDEKSLDSYAMSSDSSLTKIKDSIAIDDKTWSSKIVFYFDSPISSGKHTLKVLDGIGYGILSDGAGFPLKEESKEFTIETNDTKPEIKSVKENASGEIYITFDRPMDVKTAKDINNYEVNGKKLSDIKGANISTGSNDTIIKLKDISGGTIKPGSNVVYISDKVKDVFGNKVDDNTRVSFESIKDEKKPEVKRVEVIDSETIRVIFSKNVDYNYVTNKSNYKLEDNKGLDISSHIEGVYNSKTQTSKSNTDTYDIKLIKFNPKDSNEDWRLTSSKYNLTIKKIRDTAATPNKMDEYTVPLTGIDNVAPKVTGIYYRQNSSSTKDEVVVSFSEAMNSETLTNKDNYKFVNGEGDTDTLPDSTNILAGGDNKSAIIEFPSNYHVKVADEQENIKETGISNDVIKILVSNVKDEAGNILDCIAYTGEICVNKDGAQLYGDAIRIYYDGDDLKADIQFNKTIDNLSASDFALGGVAPSSASHSENKVTLTFKDGDLATAAEKATVPVIRFANGRTNNNRNTTKIDLIKSQGQKAYLRIKEGAETTDETGATIASLSDTLVNNQNRIYNYEAAPKTTADYWSAVKDVNGGKVCITFDTVIDANSGINLDDFTFMNDRGTSLIADSVQINGNTVIFTFNNRASFYNQVKVSAKNELNLRCERDGNDNYAKYEPSSDDLKERNITITVQ